MACHSMYVQPSFLAMHEVEVHHDVGAYPRPKTTGSDINMYLGPLVDELLLLWKEEGLRVWDEYKQETFNLRALHFVTIND
jgi:hypothetical protein